MKKQKPTRETLLHYIFDTGIKNTCTIWDITEEKLDKILNPVLDSNPRNRNISTDKIVINAAVSKIIAENYDLLWSTYVKDKEKLSMSQTSEDVFHNTLLRVLEDFQEIDEELIMKYIDYKFNTVNFQTRQNQKELYKYQIYLEDANIELC